MDSNFVKPRYDSGGFAGIPQRVTELLATHQYEAVVLFLIDGFGWRFFEKFQSAPFLQHIAHEGIVDKLTSQFPSTTAAHLTTLHTGLPVGEHGIFEWIYYEPSLDALIAPLLFSFAGTAERDTLKPAGVKPRHLFPIPTFYRSRKNQGVTSTILQHREYTPSSYSNIIFSGATARGYRTLPEALVTLSEMLAKSTLPAYFFLYNEKIDSVSHEYGPEAPQTEAEILVFLMTMERIFLKAMAGNRKKIMFLLTADHGQTETDPQTTIYINLDPRFTGVEKFIRTDQQGKLIIPAGSARDFFLYIKDGMVDEARAFLASRLEGKAEVRKVAELVDEGYFGPVISPAFRARAGDLVILPYRGESVWWFEKNKFEQNFRGHHGGLTKQEMEIPLIMWEMM
jgi:predicted AlkP superfamily pyrophosphatase or phosphodiesterase